MKLEKKKELLDKRKKEVAILEKEIQDEELKTLNRVMKRKGITLDEAISLIGDSKKGRGDDNE